MSIHSIHLVQGFRTISGCTCDGVSGITATFYSVKTNRTNLSFSFSNPTFTSLSRCSATLAEQNEVFDVDKAAFLVKDLRKSFSLGKTKSYEWRISQLKSIEKMLEEKDKEIKEALYTDLSKPELEASVAEISMTKSSCKLAIKELKHWMTPDKVKTSLATYPSSAEIVSEPLGVVLVISTWNYPFLLSLDPVIGAIAAGNAVVLKPSEIAPATSSLLLKLFEEYVDTSVIKVIEGDVPETTALLEQKWDKIFYTGSGRVGRIVMAAAAKHLTPVILELGGKCPAIVDSTVNLQVAARRIITGKWAANNGQACISVDHIITTKEFAPKLIAALVHELQVFYGSQPMESKDISRIVNAYHFTRLARLLEEDGVAEKIVYGGQRDDSRLRIAPTILLDVPDESMIMHEEIFGPFLPILTVESIKDGFDVIASKPKPLVAYMFTNDEQMKKEFVEKVSAGGILINDTIIHVTVGNLPFGGVGESGMGSYHGKFSYEAFSHNKAVMYRSFEADSSLRYPPYTPHKARILTALMNGDFLGIILALMGWSKP